MKHTEIESIVEAMNDNAFKCQMIYERDNVIAYEGKFRYDCMASFCNMFPFAMVDTEPYAPWTYFHVDVDKDSACAAVLSWLEKHSGTNCCGNVLWR